MPELSLSLIKTKIEDRVAVITFDNPPVNILTSKALAEIDQAFIELEKDPQVKVILFTTAGTNAFIAGADIKEIAQIKAGENAQKLSLQGQAVLNRIENGTKPVIAAVHGICIGGGNELIMACHMRIASERAKFGQPEINLGIIPGFGGTQRLTRLVGLPKAIELNLTGDMITAQEALRLNLVNKVVPDGELIKQSMGLAKKIASKSGLAIKQCLEAMRKGIQGTLEQGLKVEAQMFSALAGSFDMQEGVQAFLEKRQPRFQDK